MYKKETSEGAISCARVFALRIARSVAPLRLSLVHDLELSLTVGRSEKIERHSRDRDE